MPVLSFEIDGMDIYILEIPFVCSQIELVFDLNCCDLRLILATELVASSYTSDNFTTLLLGDFLFDYKFCTSSFVDLVIYI